MKSVFWGNYKGGVGKTTSTFQVAGHFALRGKKVLLIDLDPQCSLSNICCSGTNRDLEELRVDETLNYILELYMRDIESNSRFAFQLLTENVGSIARENLKQVIVQFLNQKFQGNLYFIPSSLVFPNCRMNELAQFMSENVYNIFLIRLFLNDIQLLGREDETYRFDYVFFDCPPTTNMLTQSVFLASDYYIIPTICDEVSIKGVPDYITEIEKTRNKYSLNDKIRGVLLEKVFPERNKSQFIGVFETLYKNRGGRPKNDDIIESLDKNIELNAVQSVLSQNEYEKYRYYGISPGNIRTKHIFRESVDHKDALKSGESVPHNTANAEITEEYRDLAQIIMEILSDTQGDSSEK